MGRKPAVQWRVHELKCWPKYFREVILGRKRTEFRRHDRDFQIGDVLILREYDAEKKEYTGREVRRVITYLYSPHEAPTHCVLEVEETEVEAHG